MRAFLSLIRLPNLLMIMFIQYVIRWCLIYPILRVKGLELQFTHFGFFLLSLSTVFIAAAGYIINDYFDTGIDRINKPNKAVLDIEFNRRTAMAAHLIFNILGIAIGFYLAASIGVWKLSFLYVMTAGGLWYYSTTFKRRFLIGNILIALFSAFVPLIVGLFEIPPVIRKYGEMMIDLNIDLKDLLYWIYFYSLFAFLISLIREIIKDMEDIEGDKEYGCTTLPIVWGIKTSKLIVIGIITIMIALIGYLQFTRFYQIDIKLFLYILILVQLPLLFLIYKVYRSSGKKDFRFASKLTKGIMLTGICFLILVSYLLLEAYLHVQQP